MTPGPDNLFVSAVSLAQGYRAGFFVTLGLCTGLVWHTLLVVSGLAAILASSDIALQVLTSMGVIYLLYLAWKMWKGGGEKSEEMDDRSSLTYVQAYRRGIVMNALNPKVSLFFLAFLPQFLDPQEDSLLGQTLFLGFLFTLATIIVFNGFALTASLMGRTTVLPIAFDKIASLVFVAIAIQLLASSII